MVLNVCAGRDGPCASCCPPCGDDVVFPSCVLLCVSFSARRLSPTARVLQARVIGCLSFSRGSSSQSITTASAAFIRQGGMRNGHAAGGERTETGRLESARFLFVFHFCGRLATSKDSPGSSRPSGMRHGALPKFTVTLTPLEKTVCCTARSGDRKRWSVISA